jgi:hypothetical protein
MHHNHYASQFTIILECKFDLEARNLNQTRHLMNDILTESAKSLAQSC